MNFSTVGKLICGDEAPTFLGQFDFSTAPLLLFYAYIPIIIVSAIIGLYIFNKDRKSLRGKLLLTVLSFFILWVVDILIQWVASYHTVIMFAWQLNAFFEVGLYLAALYFAFVFTNQKDLPFLGKLTLWALGLAVIIMIPTKLNIYSYDIQNCEGIIGPLWYAMYFFEPAIITALTYIGFVAARKEKDSMVHSQIVLFTTGFVFFLLTFYASNLYGQLTRTYEFNLWGPIGMVVFSIFLGYMDVKFHSFNMKLIATEALVWGLVILIGSQFFFIKASINFILNGFTFIAAMILGYFLIRTVKREIEAKEALKIMIERLEDTTNLITHQIRGVFTRTKVGLSMLIDGGFGPVTPQLLGVMNPMLQSQEIGLTEVETFLQAQKVEAGIQYDRKPIDLKAVVLEISAQEKPRAEAKGLQFEVQIDAGDFKLNGDQVYLTQVIANLIDNAIRYTQKGSIKLHLSRKGDRIVYSVQDSGVGIKDEDKAKMFTKYGHGTGSREINPSSSGLGLYIVKGIVIGHGGDIRFETSVGKETTFIVELPVK